MFEKAKEIFYLRDMKNNVLFKKVMIVGASRGLGAAVSRFLVEHVKGIEKAIFISRKEDLLKRLHSSLAEKIPLIETRACDMSLIEDQNIVSRLILDEGPDLVIYCAGGGPHGDFASKEWKDHRWAIEVGMAAPLRLLHTWIQCRDKEKMGKFIIVGSRIAESSPDFKAASYAASKHGLLGFIESVQPETKDNQNKVWLFSPGYMDTDMIPATAPVRHDGSKIMGVETAAQALLRWINKDGPWHRVLN